MVHGLLPLKIGSSDFQSYHISRCKPGTEPALHGCILKASQLHGLSHWQTNAARLHS